MGARAQDAPPDPDVVTAELLRRELAVMLPAPWRLAELQLEAQANFGTAAAPELRSRLLVTLALALPTFEQAAREGEITLARPVAPEGFRRILPARAVSTRQNGRWETRIALEPPEALEAPGRPAAALPGRVLVLGSPEEAAWRAAREAEAEAAHAAALAEQRRAAALAAERRSAEAAALHQAEAAADSIRAEQRRRDAERDALATAERAAAGEALLAAARRREAEADALAVARREAAVQALLSEARRADAQRAAEDALRLAETRRAAAEMLEAATAREAAARTAAQRAAAEERTRQIADFRARFAGDRNGRLAAYDLAMRSEDPAIRALGFEAALASQDAAAISLALRLTLLQKRELQVTIFAPAVVAPGQSNPQEVAASLAGFTITLRDINPTSGNFAGTARLGASTAAVTGSLGRSELTMAFRPAEPGQTLAVGGVAQASCSLALRLSEVQTLDGLFGCTARETPRLIARVALD